MPAPPNIIRFLKENHTVGDLPQAYLFPSCKLYVSDRNVFQLLDSIYYDPMDDLLYFGDKDNARFIFSAPLPQVKFELIFVIYDSFTITCNFSFRLAMEYENTDSPCTYSFEHSSGFIVIPSREAFGCIRSKVQHQPWV